jgi:membrane-bound lytic murein transglycosylase D
LRFVAVVLALGIYGCATQPAQPPAQPDSPAPPAAASAPAPLPAPQPAPAVVAMPPLKLADLPPFKGEHQVMPVRAPIVMVDAAAPREDLWQRVRNGFAMPDLEHALVRRQLAYYTARPEYLQRMFDRGRIYLFHIVGELEKRGMPTELALLPMVESAFNPMAYSRAHASGLWQFIPATGRRFELEQDWWYDERRDIVDSTAAALDYLQYLYEMYDDWALALASYNCGENAVRRAIVRNRKARKPVDYMSLRIPRETRNYVPKLQALKEIIRDPARFGIDLDPIPNEPYFVQVDQGFDMDLKLAAELAEMPIEEFVALNPGFKRPFIRASESRRLVLPAEKIDVYYENLAKLERDDLVSWRVYHPKKGDKFGTLAKKFHLSIAELKKVNGVPARSWRMPKVLVVPTRPEARAAASMPVMYAPPIPVSGTLGIVHRVRAGDTLSSIARRYHVTVSRLKQWNRVGKVLQIGQKIYIRKHLL